MARSRVSRFPIDLRRRPYNTLALPCECVITRKFVFCFLQSLLVFGRMARCPVYILVLLTFFSDRLLDLDQFCFIITSAEEVVVSLALVS